jgi:hypothetical protein
MAAANISADYDNRSMKGPGGPALGRGRFLHTQDALSDHDLGTHVSASTDGGETSTPTTGLLDGMGRRRYWFRWRPWARTASCGSEQAGKLGDRDHVRLPGKDLFHEHAVYVGVRVGAAVR